MGQPTNATHSRSLSAIEGQTLLRSSPLAQDIFPLLMTRVHVPPLPVSVVQRPHLIDSLNTGIHHRKLTLLLAPAGFGKTTLLSSWRVDPEGAGMATAWLSLDERDNDPKHFLAYLLFALQGMQFVEEFQQFFPPSPSEPLAEEILIRLLNVITSAITYDFVLILDDYHCITNAAIHRALRFLLQYSPQSMHFVIASRVQPPFALTRLRARGQLLELKSQDLRFRLEETGVFFNEVQGLALQAEEVEQLGQHIEGWITGLQLTAYALQKGKHVADLLRASSKSRHYILDYLASEVFHQQSPDFQELLLQTSILEQFNLSLCAAITDRTDEQRIGELLEQTDLFLLPLDEEEGWYRYYHLFRDFLLQMLTSQHPELLPLLHSRASAWFEQQGDFAAAIDHALAARDFPRAIELILHILPSLLDQCQVTLLLTWLFALPDTLILANPMLCQVYAWALIFSGITANVETYLQKVQLPESIHESDERQNIDTAYWETLLAAMRCYLANCQGDIPLALATSQHALQHLDKVDRHMRSLAILGAGSAFWLDAQENASIPLFEQAYKENMSVGAYPIACASAWALSKIYSTQGYLHKALACLQQALEQIEQENKASGSEPHPATGMLYMGVGEIFRQWDNADLANHYLLKGFALCQQWDATGVGGMALVDGAASLARMRFLEGKKAEAREFIAQADAIIQSYRLHFYVPLFFRIFKKRLRMEDAAHLTQVILSKVPKTSFLYELDQLVDVRLALDVSDYDRALELLAPLAELASATARPVGIIEVSLLQALAYAGKGQATRAMQLLSQALRDGAEEYHIRLFVDKGKPLAALLERALEARKKGGKDGLADFPLDFAASILASFATAGQKGYFFDTPAQASRAVPSDLVEPLSARELDVLHLIVQGYANQEIAQQLCLALCTVRWHVKNIYGKLQVHNRVQLALQAQKLHL